MLFGPLVSAVFRARPNRFLGVAEVDGGEVECFVPNPGRMKELLYPGARVYMRRVTGAGRKTHLDLILVDHGGVIVSVDSRIPNRVAEEAIGAGVITEFEGYRVERREPRFGASRLDLQLTDGSRKLLIEVKSCTLVVDGVALFPDAPTARGARHTKILSEALAEGRSAIMFVIQRGDAEALRPNRATDSAFADALEEARLKGVEVIAYDSKVTLEGISINRRVPVKI